MSMTINDPSTIDAEAFTVRRTVTIAAAPDKVWAAVTRPELITQWFGNVAQLDRLEVGAEGEFGFEGYGRFPIRIEDLDARTPSPTAGATRTRPPATSTSTPRCSASRSNR